jgi:hypothetical protein
LSKHCAVGGDCLSGACDAISNLCVSSSCADHRQDGNETDVDCGGSCPPCGLLQGCATNADCAPNICDPATRFCAPPRCTDGVLDGNETSVDCGGACPPCALGVACRVDQDCASTACDAISLICVANQCSDHHQDGHETDLDCGGGACSPCALGQHCTVEVDCAAPNTCLYGVANGPVCHVPLCVDGIKDGGETDVDCGGGLCTPCPLGKQCFIDYDCASHACDALSHTCVSDYCFDHHQDGDETYVDCGGPTCATRCPIGSRCISASDCRSGVCLGTVCE